MDAPSGVQLALDGLKMMMEEAMSDSLLARDSLMALADRIAETERRVSALEALAKVTDSR